MAEITPEDSASFLRECMGETLFEEEFGEYFKSIGIGSTSTISRPCNDLLQVAPGATSTNSGGGQSRHAPMANGLDHAMPPRPARNQQGFSGNTRNRPNDSGGGSTGFNSSSNSGSGFGGTSNSGSGFGGTSNSGSGFGGTSNSGSGFSGTSTGFSGDSQQRGGYDPRFTLMVPVSNCGKLIGREGSNIKKLREDYNVRRLMLIKDQESNGFRPLVVQTPREDIDKAIECVMAIMDLVSTEVDGGCEVSLTGADVVKRVARSKERLEQAGAPTPSSMSDEMTTLGGDTREQLADGLKKFLTILYGSAK